MTNSLSWQTVVCAPRSTVGDGVQTSASSPSGSYSPVPLTDTLVLEALADARITDSA